jgi:hypothetical protein
LIIDLPNSRSSFSQAWENDAGAKKVKSATKFLEYIEDFDA